MSLRSTASAKSKADFAARAVDALTPLGPVVARRMFGERTSVQEGAGMILLTLGLAVLLLQF